MRLVSTLSVGSQRPADQVTNPNHNFRPIISEDATPVSTQSEAWRMAIKDVARNIMD